MHMVLHSMFLYAHKIDILYIEGCGYVYVYVFVGAGFPMHRDLIWSIVRPL
jgi:hypothetical protein